VTTPGQPVSPEPTPPDPTVAPPAAAAAAAMQAPAPNLTPLVVLLLLLVAGAGAAVFLFVKPHLAFTNTLAAPVQVAIDGGKPVTVPAGETARLSASFGRTLVAVWELVRPLSADSAPMGEIVRGSTVVKSPRGTARAQATTRPGEADYFAPLITNATSQPLRVLVNAGLQGAMDCGCAVRPGGQRVFIGYYRLFQNSTVQVRGSSGATAAFTELGPRVTAIDGTVGLRFEDKDLRGGKPVPAR
jgi:hypothetical protein